MRQRSRTTGQALVEFALAATLIFMLLSAAIDLGLIFLTQQALYNASEEGAAYGTLSGQYLDKSVDPWAMRVNVDEIRKRVRTEAGVKGDPNQPNSQVGGMRVINLLDLNANRINDELEPAVLEEMIQVRMVASNDRNADPCPSQVQVRNCYLLVEVTAIYRPFFALAPAFGSEVRVRGYTLKPMARGGFQQGGPQP